MRLSEDPEAFQNELLAQRSKTFDNLAYGVALVLVPVSALVIYFAILDGWHLYTTVQLCSFVLIWVLTLNKRLVPSRPRVSIAAIFLFATALGEVLRVGLLSATFPMLAVLPILGTVIGGVRLGVFGIALTAAALTGIGWFHFNQQTVPFGVLPEIHFSEVEWAIRIGNLAVASTIGVFVVGALYRFHQSANDTLHRRNTDLMKSKNRLEQSARLAGLGYAITDLNAGHVYECDEAYAEMHGLTAAEFTALDIDSNIIGEIIHEEDRALAMDVKRRLSNGESVVSEMRHSFPNGQVRFIRKIFAPLDPADPTEGKFEVVSQDVTDGRRMQQQLAHTQKMDAIGQMTGGMAHDFNNLLAVIMGNLELLREEATSEREREMIDAGLGATERGANLTKSMLSFARRAELQTEVVKLNDLVREAKNWIGRTLPANIKVETSLLGGLWDVEVDPGATENALLNLILNARDAMPDGGRLTLETANIRIDDEYIEDREEDIEPGRYVMLAVSDTGHGIPDDVMENIYEPFFSTKAAGSGSGMGLSMVQGFVKQSGGAIHVYSEPDVGTTIKLYFQAVTGQADKPALQMGTRPGAPEAGRSILVVEDDAEVLAVLDAGLKKAGYAVTSAATGDEAFEIFAGDPAFDALLTDIVMPGTLRGTELARSMRAINPDLPVVFMSGYAREATVHGNGLHPGDIRLMKPVRMSELIRALETALGSSEV